MRRRSFPSTTLLPTLHTPLAQASLGVLLAVDDTADKQMMTDYPFAIYAARHWVDHARFDDVSICIHMKRLFTPTEPHFAAWVWLYDNDYQHREIMFTEHPTPPEAVPLDYTTLCGFRDIVDHLIVTCPQVINARGGLHCTPLHVASVKGNTDIMMFLLDNKGDAALNLALPGGELDAARMLLRYRASVESPSTRGWAPLKSEPRHEHQYIVRMLLDHDVMVDSRNNINDCSTPLILAPGYGRPDIVRVLLKNGATADSCNNDGWTSLLPSSQYGHPDIVRLLLDHGAMVDSRNDDG